MVRTSAVIANRRQMRARNHAARNQERVKVGMESRMSFSERYKFSDWPNASVPVFAAGVYAIWDSGTLIYCGMSGREFEKAQSSQPKRYGLITRLASHASGRLSGDQFCMYVANRLVIPSLQAEELRKFASGDLTLERLTKTYIQERFEYQFAVVESRLHKVQGLNSPRTAVVLPNNPSAVVVRELIYTGITRAPTIHPADAQRTVVQ